MEVVFIAVPIIIWVLVQLIVSSDKAATSMPSKEEVRMSHNHFHNWNGKKNADHERQKETAGRIARRIMMNRKEGDQIYSYAQKLKDAVENDNPKGIRENLWNIYVLL